MWNEKKCIELKANKNFDQSIVEIKKINNDTKYPVNLYSYFVGKNPYTSFNASSKYPSIESSVFIGPFSTIIGDVTINKHVFIACNVTIRADEGTPFYIGSNSNIQDGVIFHGLKNNQFVVNKKKYSIYVGDNTSIAHGALIHGPCIVGNNVFVGFNSLVFNSIVEDGCYIASNATVSDGVRIKANKFVPTGALIDTQAKADDLDNVPKDSSDFAKKVVKVNVELESSYSLMFGDVKCSCGLCCNSKRLEYK
ncbi:carbonate dehydratase [Clostridium gasigenes]|uniref:carbonate dehydratase n=1 Tax=Clostridium gasigenes TaxID=94869 RepID=UPI001C0D44BA|nr:carbonate dehydratase [Clostridium gasigenes]MBU3106905.1 carbonate dehydratase [Clostridium gasigenes]